LLINFAAKQDSRSFTTHSRSRSTVYTRFFVRNLPQKRISRYRVIVGQLQPKLGDLFSGHLATSRVPLVHCKARPLVPKLQDHKQPKCNQRHDGGIRRRPGRVVPLKVQENTEASMPRLIADVRPLT
jgi:hypothetical protein